MPNINVPRVQMQLCAKGVFLQFNWVQNTFLLTNKHVKSIPLSKSYSSRCTQSGIQHVGFQLNPLVIWHQIVSYLVSLCQKFSPTPIQDVNINFCPSLFYMWIYVNCSNMSTKSPALFATQINACLHSTATSTKNISMDDEYLINSDFNPRAQ